MQFNPAVRIAELIHTLGIAELGKNLWVGLVRPGSSTVPAEAVFVMGTDGLPPDRFFAQQDEVRHPTIMIRIRSPDYNSGYELARKVYDAVQSSRPPGIKDVSCRQSEPIYLGQDNNAHHGWSLNFDLFYQE